jgi:chromosomal replication initiation ATPase DnaA
LRQQERPGILGARKQIGSHRRVSLGDSEFVQDVISGLDDLVKKNLRLSGQRINMAALAQQVCQNYNISLGKLRSGSRRREVAEARGSIS